MLPRMLLQSGRGVYCSWRGVVTKKLLGRPGPPPNHLWKGILCKKYFSGNLIFCCFYLSALYAIVQLFWDFHPAHWFFLWLLFFYFNYPDDPDDSDDPGDPDDSWTTLGPLCDHSGTNLWSLWDHPWITLGSFFLLFLFFLLLVFYWCPTVYSTFWDFEHIYDIYHILVSFCRSVPPEFLLYFLNRAYLVEKTKF